MTFITMLKDESGASAAEYALILAIVGSGIAIAAVTLGGSISNAMAGASDRIEECTVEADGTTGAGCQPAAGGGTTTPPPTGG